MKPHTDPRDESVLGKLSNQTRRIIEALARSPFADKAVAEQEKATIERRTTLGVELAKLDATVTDERLVSALVAARAGVEKAHQAVKVAEQKFWEADQVVFNAENVVARRRATVLQELHDTADERLWQFIGKLRGIVCYDLSLAIRISVDVKKN